MTELTLNSVSKQYDGPEGSIKAVDSADLHIRDGEFLILVGPSGCGKSTTLRIVAGLETVTEGNVCAGGVNITNKKPRNRDVAMVFQNYALYPHKTVRENISYGLEKSRELSDAEIDSKVNETIELLEIDGLGEKKPDELSGGQKQRVALGRAIVRDPAVFLMDEPLSNLDAKLRMTMRTEIQQLQAELGTTTVYVTHDQEEAMSMSDRIAVMNNGRIQQLGTPEEVYERPNNRFVAEFIGSPSMNFFNVRHQSGNLSGDGIELVIPEVADHLDTGWYTLGVRPEDIQLDINNEMSNTATVEVVEPIGSQSIVYLNIADSELRVTVSRDEAPAINREIGFIIPPEAIHLFDSDSGEAVGYGKSFTNDTEKNVVSDQSATTESLQGE